jgi:hypothetical protein
MKSDYKYLEFLLDYKVYLNIDAGSTPKEVDKLEAKLGIKFPACYRELYIILGMNRAFTIGPENNYSYPDYEGMNTAAKGIANSIGLDLDIGGNVFVFCCFAETDFFWFFKLDEGDNPPIYQYEGGDDDYVKVADNLPEFIQNMDWYRGFLSMKENYPPL